MNVTEDVIRDLHVLVQAGEASADTRALVAAWLAGHPALAAELSHADALPPAPAAPALPPDAEYRALRRAKAMLTRRTWSMAMGFCFTFLPLSFMWDHGGVHFFLLPRHPVLAAVSVGLGLVAWLEFARASRALGASGL